MAETNKTTYGTKMRTFGQAGVNFHRSMGEFLQDNSVLDADDPKDAFWIAVNAEDNSHFPKKMQSRRAGKGLVDVRKDDGAIRWSELQVTFKGYRTSMDNLKNIDKAAKVCEATFDSEGVCIKVAAEPRGMDTVKPLIYNKKGHLVSDSELRELARQYDIGDELGKSGKKSDDSLEPAEGETPIQTARRAAELFAQKSTEISFEDLAELEAILNRTYEQVAGTIMLLNKKAA